MKKELMTIEEALLLASVVSLAKEGGNPYVQALKVIGESHVRQTKMISKLEKECNSLRYRIEQRKK